MKTAQNTTSAYSKNSFQCLKGYLAVCVLIHHLFQFDGFYLYSNTVNTSFGYSFYLLGHWAVALFMFLSGFGLYSSYLSKGRAYIKGFPRNRLLPYYASYLFFVIVYLVFELARGKNVEVGLVLHSLTYGGTVIHFGWYFQLALLLYVIFYVLMLVIRNERIFLPALCIAVLALMSYHFCIASYYNVYEPAAIFIVGVIAAIRRIQRGTLFEVCTWKYLLISLTLFFATTLVHVFMTFRHSELMELNRLMFMLFLILLIVADTALGVFFISFAVVAAKYFPKVFFNPLSKFFGTHSLEIYALQGLLLYVVNIYISNRIIFAMVTISCILLLSIPIHILLSKFKKLVYKEIN